MLHITERLSSGFHHLQSLIMFKGEGDQIEVHESKTFSLDINGPFSASLPVKNNLVLKAAEWLYGLCNIDKKAHITLTKNLPISSGIGGGSSDAATAIAALIDMWGIDFSDLEKKEIIQKSGELGADVPVCLAHHLLKKSYFWIDGSGKEGSPEPLWEEDPLREYSMLLVNPKIAVSTPVIFRLYDGVYDEGLSKPTDASGFLDFLKNTGNALTKPATQLVPEIESILNALKSSNDCLLTRMSGSGATCFGIYKNVQARDEAVLKMNPHWWVCEL